MNLSEQLGDRLAAQFSAASAPGSTVPAAVGVGHWYCPACSLRLGSDLVCPQCQESLRPYLFELVELHPHRSERTAF